MCPACLTTAALAFAGATSAGGLAALAVKKLRARTGAPPRTPIPATQGAQDGTRENRVAK